MFRLRSLEAALQGVRASPPLRNSKACCRRSCPRRRLPTWCRQSISGKARAIPARNSRETTCRQKYLHDGELARHLNLQSGRLTTYDLARKEAINCLRVKQRWMAPGTADPMDLSPLGTGKCGKKGKRKGKGDKSGKSKACFYCCKPGHSKSECTNFSAALREKGSAARQSGPIRWRGG